MWNDPEHLEMREVLGNGADRGIRDNCGSTRLELAKGEGFSELAELLSRDSSAEEVQDVELVGWESP